MTESKPETNHSETEQTELKTTETGAWVLASPQAPPPKIDDHLKKTHSEKGLNKAPIPPDQIAEKGELTMPPKDDREALRAWQLELRERIKTDLEGLAFISNDIGLSSMAEEIRTDRIPTLVEERFTVVLLGEFNHGKSTVVNALMGDDVLPMGITPTTSVITHLTEGSSGKAYIKKRREKEKIEVARDKLDQLIRDTNDDTIEYIEIEQDNHFLEGGVTLVDTPGVNDISKQKVEITYGYLPHADVIIYVLDATQILKKSEITFLSEKLITKEHNHIIFVLGKIDTLSPEEAQEVKKYATEKLNEILGETKLYAFSAREALQAQKEGGTPDAAFTKFQKEIIELVDKNRAFIVFDSALSASRRYITQIKQNLSIRKSALAMEVDEINDRIAAVNARYQEAQLAISESSTFIETKISEIIATSTNNLKEFSKSFANALPREIEAAASDDIQTHLTQFIQSAYTDWLEEEGRQITQRLEALAVKVIEVTNQTMAETLKALRADLGLTRDVNLEVDTFVYDVSIFALGTAGFATLFVNLLLGGVLTLATPILALYLKGKTDQKVKQKAKDEGIKAITAAEKIIEKQMRTAIESYGLRLKNFVETAGDHLFKQIAETLETVKKDLEENPNLNELNARTDAELSRTNVIAKRLEQAQKLIAEKKKSKKTPGS